MDTKYTCFLERVVAVSMLTGVKKKNTLRLNVHKRRGFIEIKCQVPVPTDSRMTSVKPNEFK